MPYCKGMHALHTLIKNNLSVAVKLLLQNGTDVNARCEHDGKMPLQMATRLENIEIFLFQLSIMQMF